MDIDNHLFNKNGLMKQIVWAQVTLKHTLVMLQ